MTERQRDYERRREGEGREGEVKSEGELALLADSPDMREASPRVERGALSFVRLNSLGLAAHDPVRELPSPAQDHRAKGSEQTEADWNADALAALSVMPATPALRTVHNCSVHML